MLEQLEKAIKRGAHPSAKTPRAAKACREEAQARVKDKCMILVSWSKLKKIGISKNLKISPIAAIPHKSREFCMILDLTFALTINRV